MNARHLIQSLRRRYSPNETLWNVGRGPALLRLDVGRPDDRPPLIDLRLVVCIERLRQSDLSASHERIGGVLQAQGNLPAALESYKSAHAIRQRLAAADPGNAGWQRGLAISYGNVAMVEARQGVHDQALSKFRTARDIIARLRAQSPDNAQLPEDLAWFESQIRALSASR